MPGGHASHKSTSVKPNTNTNGLTNAAAEEVIPIAPEEVVGNTTDSTRTDEAPINPAAVQRPEPTEEQE